MARWCWSGGGEEVTRFGPISGNETFMSPTMDLGAYPFGAGTHGDAATGRLVVGTGDGPEYRVYGPDGRLARIVWWPDPERAYGGAIVERSSAHRPRARSSRRQLRDVPTARQPLMITLS